ncbi:MAG: hypothetical protein VYE02_07740, partial [Verrucomicrobiota bacterium]|nr:hypothetical protein [Verrucomicrobiota bacterium]
WGNTNQLPAMVRFRLGFARPGSKEVEEGRIIERIVQLPGQTVQAAWQRPVVPNGMGTPNVNQNRPQTQ